MKRTTANRPEQASTKSMKAANAYGNECGTQARAQRAAWTQSLKGSGPVHQLSATGQVGHKLSEAPG